MAISGVDPDIAHTAAVLLQRSLHDLRLHADLPNADLALHATGNDARAVISGSKCGNTVVMRVVNSVQEFTALRKESTDLTIIPTGEDAAAVVHELDSEALEAWHLDTEELLAGGHVPDTDVVDRAGREQVGVAGRERDIVDALVMASVPELGRERVRVSPVDGGLGAAGEEVSGVGSQGDGRAGAGDFLLALDLHHRRADLELSDGAIARTDDHVTVGEELHAVNAHGEETVARADALEEAALEVDLNDVAGEGAQEGARIVG